MDYTNSVYSSESNMREEISRDKITLRAPTSRSNVTTSRPNAISTKSRSNVTTSSNSNVAKSRCHMHMHDKVTLGGGDFPSTPPALGGCATARGFYSLPPAAGEPPALKPSDA